MPPRRLAAASESFCARSISVSSADNWAMVQRF
jgi:hypothetical protein